MHLLHFEERLMKVDLLRLFVFIVILVVSVILAVKWELTWYVGFFFVWGVTNFTASFIKAIQEQLDNPK